MCLVYRPTYPYSESPSIDDVMTLLYRRAITLETKQRINSDELIKFNYMLLIFEVVALRVDFTK